MFAKHLGEGRGDGRIQIGRPLDVTDPGIPVANEGIYTLAANRRDGILYGATYPGRQFFSYSIADGQFTQHGQLAQKRIPGERFENEKAIGRALAIDAEGAVFTSGEGGRFYRFSPKRRKLESLGLTLPGVPGREVYNRVGAWAAAPEGALYGDASNGHPSQRSARHQESQ